MNSYNDGVVSIYNSNNNLNSFSAKLNQTKVENEDFVINLFFCEESKRQQDVMFANSFGKALTLKIKTPFSKKVNTTQKAVIDNVLYDIFFVDFSKNKKELFIYLEEVRKLGI